MTAKEYLGQVSGIRAEIGALDEKIARIRSRLETGRLSSLTGMPRGGQSADWADVVDQLSVLENQLTERVRCLTQLEKEIMDAIASVPDPTCRAILEYRYLNGWEWHRIARRMHYDKRWVQELHKRTLERIDADCYENVPKSAENG